MLDFCLLDCCFDVSSLISPHCPCQHRLLSGLRRSLVHSLMIVRHCVLRNWDRILVRAVRGLIDRGDIVLICLLLCQRDVKLQQTKKIIVPAQLYAKRPETTSFH